MAHNWPTSSFEKTPSIGRIHQRANAAELIHSRSDIVREALLSHIAAINPELAQEIMTSPTEEHVLSIIGRVNQVSHFVSVINEGKFAESANDMVYELAA